MNEAPARVTRVEGEGGEGAWVVSKAPASCGACGGKGCGSSVFARLWHPDEPEFLVSNPVGAQPGEEVVIGLPEGALWQASLRVYVLPLILLLACAGAGQALGGEPAAVWGGLCGLVLAAAVLRLSRKAADPPVILRRGSTVCRSS